MCTCLAPGGGLLPYICLIGICAAPKRMVFAPFWSENGYRLCLFLSDLGLVSREFGSAWTYLSFQL